MIYDDMCVSISLKCNKTLVMKVEGLDESISRSGLDDWQIIIHQTAGQSPAIPVHHHDGRYTSYPAFKFGPLLRARSATIDYSTTCVFQLPAPDA